MLDCKRNITCCLLFLLFSVICGTGAYAGDPVYTMPGEIGEVVQEKGRIKVLWDGMPRYMKSSFTLKDCGRELKATFRSLQGLIGKNCEARYEEVTGGVELVRIECTCEE